MTRNFDRSATPRLLTRDVFVGLLVAATGSWWLSWLHPAASAPTGGALEPLVLLPFIMPLVLITLPVTALRLRRLTDADNVPAGVLRCALLMALVTSAGAQWGRVVLGRGSVGAATLTSFADDATTLIVVLLPVVCLLRAGRHLRPARSGAPCRTGLAAGLALVTAVGVGGLAPASAAPTVVPGSCLDGGPVDKSFDVTALDVDIPINRFGDHDPGGKMYALTSRVPAVRVEEASQHVSIGLRDD